MPHLTSLSRTDAGTESANKLGTKCEHEDRYWQLMGWLKIADIISVDSLRFPVRYDGDFITPPSASHGTQISFSEGLRCEDVGDEVFGDPCHR